MSVKTKDALKLAIKELEDARTKSNASRRTKCARTRAKNKRSRKGGKGTGNKKVFMSIRITLKQKSWPKIY